MCRRCVGGVQEVCRGQRCVGVCKRCAGVCRRCVGGVQEVCRRCVGGV